MADEKTENTENTEKKENGFAKLFKKAKQTISDSVLESKLEAQFNRSHNEFTVYTPSNTILSNFTVYGAIENDRLTYFGDREILPFCVIVNSVTKQAYYAGADEGETAVRIHFEGETYERSGRVILLDPNVTEVRVIKAGDRYFLYRGGNES